MFIERTDAEAETPLLWSPCAKSWLIGKNRDAGRDWGQEEKGTTEDEMAGWHHRLDAHEFGWTLGIGDGQGGMACCSSWGCKESDTTELLNWTELNLCVHGSTIFYLFPQLMIENSEWGISCIPWTSKLIWVRIYCSDFPGGSNCEESTPNAGDPGLIPGSGWSPREHGNPLRYSCLGNPMDRGAWQATIHGVAKSQTWLNN